MDADPIPLCKACAHYRMVGAFEIGTGRQWETENCNFYLDVVYGNRLERCTKMRETRCGIEAKGFRERIGPPSPFRVSAIRLDLPLPSS
jgi:hypothetical protein